MLSCITTFALKGIEAVRYDCECFVGDASPMFVIVGLGGKDIKEVRYRVQQALMTVGLWDEGKRITVSVKPEMTQKQPGTYDLAIALGIALAQVGQGTQTFAAVGTLDLAGNVLPVRGVLAAAMAAKREGLALICPQENHLEAMAVDGLDIYLVETVAEALKVLAGQESPQYHSPEDRQWATRLDGVDMDEVHYQESAKRGLLIAAAGGHNVRLVSPVGSEKTILARRFPGILPSMTAGERFDATLTHSAAGILERGTCTLAHRPFRAPHYTVSEAGMFGNSSGAGEVTLADRGVLFLDELCEFPRRILDGIVHVIRDQGIQVGRDHIRLPARFQLITAMNACPCGWYGSGRDCKCRTETIERYLKRGQVLDSTTDMVIQIQPKTLKRTAIKNPSDLCTANMRFDVEKARAIQARRFEGSEITCNNEIRGRHRNKKYCELTEGGLDILAHAGARVNAVVRVARTIADLAGGERIEAVHMAEALQYQRCTQTQEVQ